MKVILGAGNTTKEGWVSTQESQLNLLDEDSFHRFFGREGCAEAFLAEHVLEHLSFAEGREAAARLYRYLAPGGWFRAAVPDCFFQNEWYHNLCKPGGPGPKEHPAYTHKVFYDYRTLTEVLQSAGFVVDLLEYCDESGRFHYNHWDPAQGKIGRSLRFDTRNRDGGLGMVSLIVDARKES